MIIAWIHEISKGSPQKEGEKDAGKSCFVYSDF